METIYIYNGASRLTIPITDSAERSHSLQQHNYVKLVWKSAENTPISANAYIEYEGQVFYALDDYFPTHKDGIYEYDIEFHAIEDTFNRPLFFRYVEVTDQTTGKTTSWKEIEWSLNGNLKTIADIVITCLNRAYDNAYFELPTDSYTDTLLMSYSFSGNSIADALSTIAEQNETEWWLETTTEYSNGKHKYILHFDKCEIGTTIELNDHYTEDANGVWQSGGLKSVSQLGNTNIIPQKLYVYGSERNIIKKTVEEETEGGKMNVSYDKKLRLPSSFPNGTKEHTIESAGVTLSLNDDSSISIGGINNHFEKVKIFDEVYPKMDMEVTAVSVQNPNSENPIYWLKGDRLTSITDEAPVDGSINPGKLGLLIEGCTLMCTFTSGLLNGREFECAWRESSAEIGLIPIDENDVQIPSGVYKPNVGDTFILWNLAMPQSSITIAQNELCVEAINYIEELATSITETDCVSEPEAFLLAGYPSKPIKDENENIIGWEQSIKVGQRISVNSNVFRNGRLSSRIIKYSYKLTTPYDVNFTLASSRQTGRLATLENMIADVTHKVHAVNQVQQAISRRQWHDTEEMMSMLDSIQKQMVVVGDENNAFGTTCSLEYDSDTKRLLVSEGYVLHQSFTDNDFNGQWNIDSFTRDISAIDPDGKTPFYVFFVCPKSKETAEKGYTDVASALPMYDDYYVFILGILSSEFEGKRAFNQTNGITSIAGGNVTTNVIQDPGQRLIVDFANATITARNGATIKGAIQFEKGEGENDLGTVLENMGKDVQYAKDNTQATNLFSRKQIDQYASEEGVDSYIKNYNLSTGVIECIDDPIPYFNGYYDIFGRYENYKQGVQYSMKMNVDLYLISGYLEFSVYCDTVRGETHELFFHYAENQGEQQHIEIECTTPEGEDIKSIYFEILHDGIDESSFIITHPQLVEGNVIPTTWQPNMEDVTTDVQEAHEAAKDAELEADKAKERMDNWVADNVFSKLEQQGLEDELRKIQADYSEISTECSKYDIGMGDYFIAHDNIVEQLQDIILKLNTNETTAIPSNFEKNLDEYYTQRTAILTTISNKADEVAQKYADNAATNAVDGLEIGGVNLISNIPSKWEQGSFSENSAIGTDYEKVCNYNSTTRIRVKEAIEVKGNIYVKIHNSGYMAAFTQFDENKKYLGKETFVGGHNDAPHTLHNDTRYICLILRKSDNTTITPDEISKVKIQLEQGNKATSYKPNEADIIEAKENILNGAMLINFEIDESSNYNNVKFKPNSNDDKNLTTPLKANTEYVFSIESILLKNGSLTPTNIAIGIFDSSISTTKKVWAIPYTDNKLIYKLTTPSTILSTDVLLIYGGQNGATKGVGFTAFGVKLAEGNKYIPWEGTSAEQQALITLNNAMKGSTDIIGGLVLTNLIQLKNEEGDVVAGITGLTTANNTGEGDVFAWAGGSLSNAISGTTPVLLKRQGKGSKVGCLVVEDDDKVRVKTNNGSVLIDADGGITVYNGQGTSEIEKIKILNEDIDSSNIELNYYTALPLYNNLTSEDTLDSFTALFESDDIVITEDRNIITINSDVALNITLVVSLWAYKNGSNDTRLYSYGIMKLALYDVNNKTDYEVIFRNGITNYISYSSSSDTNPKSFTEQHKLYSPINEEYRDLPLGTYRFRLTYENSNLLNPNLGQFIPMGTSYGRVTSWSLTTNIKLTAEWTTKKPITVIGNNGMIVRSEYKTAVYIDVGDNNELDMRFVGLPTSAPSEKGRLYNSGGTLKIS